MIEMQYNFPLLPGQGEQWQQRLRAAVDDLHVNDANQLRPTYRNDQMALRAVAAKWIGSPSETTWIVCSGHHGVLVSLMAAGLAGKTIAAEGITYGGILHQAKFLGCPVAAVEFDDEGMTPESLRSVCEAQEVAAVFVMPTVQNPVGFTAGLARREAIVAVAREFDLVILEDDAYGYMQPDAPVGYRVLAPERTFYVRGLSKIYCPATRTGFLVAPERYKGAIDLAMMNTASGTSLIHNAAAVSLIADGSMQELIERKLVEGARRNAAAREVLAAAAVRVAPGAKTGWHLWVLLPDGMEAVEAQRLCAERGVLVSGGHGFAAPGVVARGMRVALGGEVEFERVMEGVKVVGEVVGS
ncbi:aminotransferase class I/II-fold pyridoxal phosphate-dependent enzyme [Granulicella paludicola]|uniref:aminotransferase class I/II-fold pyridoxal phosphate-dependent enzyme n=1 Tax=Granulicella paludicola TaxID=474951 RepID=UPI0021E0C167|nr:PLP-dependent aminotransferase family protein [Granulicella paludicola]